MFSFQYFQASTEVLSNWAVETFGDLQSTSRGLCPGVKYKIHMIPILMHQMRISTTCLFGDAQAEKFGNSKCNECMDLKELKAECREM
jgi:hypothetical protein